MKAYRKLFIIIIFLIPLALEARPANQSVLIKHVIKSTEQQYASDRRTAVFDIYYRQTKKGIVIFGEVDTLTVKDTLIARLRRNIKGEVIDSIRMLPDTALGGYRNGIVIIEVGDILDKPHKQGKLTTQVLMGTVVALLKKAEGYYFIQMPDRYLGWIDTASVSPANQYDVAAWNNIHKVIITELKCNIRKTPDSSSAPLCNVVAGCILKKEDQNDVWTTVELADGRKGFIQNIFVQDLDSWRNSRNLSGDNLEKTAITLLGIRYIWGGTSVKGMDCSGFTKMVYRLNGMELHRDADQQAHQGITIDPGNKFEKLRKGDLLFFRSKKKRNQSKYITHVGLSLGSGLFIHSSISKYVRLSSLDPSSNYFEKSLLKRFVLARRIIQK